MLALLYHDFVEPGHDDASGFPGAGAARYKLTPHEFRTHLDAIAQATLKRAVHTTRDAPLSADGLLFTFDDGGVSAATIAASLLESHGWRGHFFITTDRLDTPGFVSREQAVALHRAGHVIGSHSASHPERMSLCSYEVLVDEWRRSREALASVLDEPVTTASVPGGFYSRRVAAAASAAGIRVLFTSEPTCRPHTVHECLVLGRYTLYRGMTADQAAALASGRLAARLKQAALWKLKKAAKSLGGRGYLALRARLLRRVYDAR